jgi:hypothetical protein
MESKKENGEREVPWVKTMHGRRYKTWAAMIWGWQEYGVIPDCEHSA